MTKAMLAWGYIYNGLKHFSAKRPLIAPSDAEGLKFRVQTSDVAVAMIEAMGRICAEIGVLRSLRRVANWRC